MRKTEWVSFDRAFAAIATLAVITGVIAGFWVIGTPGRQRSIKADRQRLQDLKSIASNLYNQAQEQEDFELPASLESDQLKEDPLTEEPYEYQRLSESTYELCAEFDTDSSSYPLQNTSRERESDFWQHNEGHHCFEFDINERAESLLFY